MAYIPPFPGYPAEQNRLVARNFWPEVLTNMHSCITVSNVSKVGGNMLEHGTCTAVVM